jgi:hypothetical protein
MIDAVGYGASILTLIGCYGVAYKRLWGLLTFSVSDCIWAYVGYETGLTSLVVISLILAGGNLAAATIWRRDNV